MSGINLRGDTSGSVEIKAADAAQNNTLTLPNSDGTLLVDATSGGVSIADSLSHTGDTDTAIRFPAADTFTVETAGTEALRVSSNQRVGIGTDDPAALLDVQGILEIGNFTDISPDAAGSGQLRIDANGYNPYIAADATAMHIGHNSSARDLRLQTNETDRLTIDGSTGNVGIGTDDPSFKLHISDGDIFLDNERDIRWGSSDACVIEGSGGASGYMSLGVNGEKVRILRSGNVGINTDDPGVRLEVNGQAAFENGIQVQNNDGYSMMPTERITATQAGDSINNHTFAIDCNNYITSNHDVMLRVSFCMKRGNTATSFSQKSQYFGLLHLSRIVGDQHVDANHIVQNEMSVDSTTVDENAVVTITFDTTNVRSFRSFAVEYVKTASGFPVAI